MRRSDELKFIPTNQLMVHLFCVIFISLYQRNLVPRDSDIIYMHSRNLKYSVKFINLNNGIGTLKNGGRAEWTSDKEIWFLDWVHLRFHHMKRKRRARKGANNLTE